VDHQGPFTHTSAALLRAGGSRLLILGSLHWYHALAAAAHLLLKELIFIFVLIALLILLFLQCDAIP
jgi:hypothetical protein